MAAAKVRGPQFSCRLGRGTANETVPLPPARLTFSQAPKALEKELRIQLDRSGVGIEPFVASLAVKISGQRHGHAATPAAHIQDGLVRLKPAEFDKVSDKGFSNALEISADIAHQSSGRHQRIPSP